MQYKTKLKIAAVHQACDLEDKSLEYTFQSIMDLCVVDNDAVVSYFRLGESEHKKLWSEVNELVELVIKIDKAFGWKDADGIVNLESSDGS